MMITSEDISSSPADSEQQDIPYVEVNFTATGTGPLYRCDTTVPDSAYGSADLTTEYLGYYHEGDSVTDIIELNEVPVSQTDFMRICARYAYAVADNSQVNEYAKEINGRNLDVVVEKDTKLRGSFTASEGQVILFTIPWDEGWTCYVDGQKVDIEKTWDMFMSINAPKGYHTFELRFFPAWLNYGLIVFGIASAGLIVFLIGIKKRDKHKKKPVRK
jgi:uncharacterized membrane protein YfhO